MPFDPNADTSDVGQMYRQFLQSKGMPITQENLQRVIAQSQREPGMIAGLSVQQAPTTPSAPTPPNLAGASPSSSGAPLPTPPIPPRMFPQDAMAGPEAGASRPPVQAPSMAPQGSGPPTQVIGPQMDIGGNDIAIPATPPPGQAPAPQQSTQPAPPPSSIADMILSGLTGLGVLGGGAAALRGGRGGQGQPSGPASPPTAAQPPSVPTPGMSGRPGFMPQSVANTGNNPLAQLPKPMQGPPVGPPPMQGPPGPMQGPPPPVQGPPIAPMGPHGPMQGPPIAPMGPPTAPVDAATSPIGNILMENLLKQPGANVGTIQGNPQLSGKPPPIGMATEMPPTVMPRTRVRARGVRVP